MNDSPRYDPDHLVSGGMDFTVVLWDISNGTKLHTFSVHGGEIMQLIVPPENCNVSIYTQPMKEFSFLAPQPFTYQVDVSSINVSSEDKSM